MIRNLILILLASAFIWSCGNQQNVNLEQVIAEDMAVEEPITMSLAEFKEKAPTLVGNEVTLEGTVIHVCEHGGQKMFITADDPDVRIKITTGEEMAAFEPELKGSTIRVIGVVEEIESEVVGEGQNAEEEKHEEDADHKNIYHVPQYSVVCLEFMVLDAESPEEK